MATYTFQKNRPASSRWLLAVVLSGLANAGAALLVAVFVQPGDETVTETELPREQVFTINLEDLPNPESVSEPLDAATNSKSRTSPKLQPPADEKEPTPVEPEKEPEIEPEEPPPEPEPEPEQPVAQPAQPVPPKLHQKMVQQLQETNEATPPPDANYLSNVNRNVQVETRARETNLQSDAAKVETTQQENSRVPEKGDAATTKIAQQQGTDSEHQRQEGQPSVAAVAPKQEAQPREGPKTMQQLREATVAMEQVKAIEDLAKVTDGGTLSASAKAQDAQAAQDGGTEVANSPSVASMRANHESLMAMAQSGEGGRALAPASAASKRAGVWDEARKRFQSPLENMVPEVQIGNQTALRSRAHPFALYIATVHRQIHELWAYGFLERWDGQRQGNFNDYRLWSRVEMVIDPQGAVEKVSTVHFSGNASFDQAARDVVWSAGPFPPPPGEIRSGNGKVYIHWAFHRDERACGTFGADPFILDNLGQGDRPDPHGEIHVHGGAGEQTPAQPRRLMGPARAPGAPGPRPKPSAAPARMNEPSASTGSASPGVQSDPSSDPGAMQSAKWWSQALAKGSVDRLLKHVGTPFATGGAHQVSSKERLGVYLRDLAAELNGQNVTSVRLLSAAALLKELGGLPAGIEPGEERVYARVIYSPDRFVLMLEKRAGFWRIIGLARE